MKVIQRDLALCIDCTMAAVNDDFTDLTPARESAIRGGLAELGPHLVSDSNPENGEGYIEFSARRCDCCHSPLLGSRYRFAILGE